MDDVIRVVLIAIGVMLAVFVIVVGLLMWRYRIPPRGVFALGMAGFYLLTPVDVLPEAVLGPLGLADDAGVAGLVLAAVLGKRRGFGSESMAPSNLALTVIGAGLVWVGWFGFNGGSALAANALAGNALLVTQVAAAVGALVWLAVEKFARGKASVLGGVSGAVAGLVGITPAAGFVTVSGALWIGILTSIGCFYSVNYLKRLLKIDDSLDAFGLHGIGGIIGAVLTGIFVSPAVIGKPLETSMISQVIVQLEGVIATIV